MDDGLERMVSMRDLSKFKGCLIGGAVGDALGYAVEFLSAGSIFKKYGENGIAEYELHHGVAEISDDTQMTLFTATGLLVGTTRGMRAVSWEIMPNATLPTVIEIGIGRRPKTTRCRRNIITRGW